MSVSVLVAVTHLLGVGHLTRAAALGRGLAAAGHRVTLVSGGRAAPLVSTEGLTLVQLPAVQCRGVDFRTLLDDDGQPIGEARRQARIARLLAALEEADPDVVVTETFPFGRRQLAAEFQALLAAAAARPRPPAVLASIRDILNPPSKPERAVEAEAVLGRFYDGVMVHGDAAATPLAASWPVSPGLERRLVYTGYVAEGAAPAAADESDRAEILVSGGGGAAGLPLFEAALGAAALLAGPWRWRILVGHGVPAAALEALAARAGPRVTVERARADFPALLARAAVSVSQAGYNTMIDLAQARTPAVLVPFEQGNEAEQRLRAGRFAARGVAGIVPEADLSPESLARAVAEALERPRPAGPGLDLGGIAGSVRAVEAAAGRREARLAAWSRLDRALAHAAAAQRAVRIWWRDDDAVAPGPALDRLLALSRRHGVPLALAVIPASAEPDLARRLDDEPLASVLVHGYSHRNHAPAGAKKQEFGHRDPAAMAAQLAEGLQRLVGLFGRRCLPVLVPPWNRIDPALVPRLAGLGFAGLSVHGPRPGASAAGLALANTHLDPIDWKGDRGLAEEAGLVDRLAAEIERLAVGAQEPFGLLTHHLVHDAWLWGFVERLLQRLAGSPAVHFAPASTLFGNPEGRERV